MVEELADLDVHDAFVGPEVVVDAGMIENFCAVIGNDGESFKSIRNADMIAPMDFAIVTGWQVCINFMKVLIQFLYRLSSNLTSLL